MCVRHFFSGLSCIWVAGPGAGFTGGELVAGRIGAQEPGDFRSAALAEVRETRADVEELRTAAEDNATVLRSSATHAILTVLKAGERIRQFDAKTVLIQQLQWHHHFFRHFLA